MKPQPTSEDFELFIVFTPKKAATTLDQGLVMVYRHGIELALKHLAERLPWLFDETAAIKLTHRLMDNWQAVRSYLERLDGGPDCLDAVEAHLREFVEIDPNGETFRFPTARDGTPHLQDVTLINADVFAKGMSFLSEFFTESCDWIDHLRCEKAEMEAYYEDHYGY